MANVGLRNSKLWVTSATFSPSGRQENLVTHCLIVDFSLFSGSTSLRFERVLFLHEFHVQALLSDPPDGNREARRCPEAGALGTSQ